MVRRLPASSPVFGLQAIRRPAELSAAPNSNCVKLLDHFAFPMTVALRHDTNVPPGGEE